MDYKPAHDTLETFLTALTKKNWGKMYRACQLTWKKNNSKARLQVYKDLEVEDFTIGKLEVIQEVAVRFDVIVTIKGKKYVSRPKLICEKKPYTPKPDGRWGVNPISFLKKSEYEPET